MAHLPKDWSDYEWQIIGNDSWAFGKVVRGIVRKRLATVNYCQTPQSVGSSLTLRMEWGWYWSYGDGQEKTRGIANSIEEAVNICEKGLGVVS